MIEFLAAALGLQASDPAFWLPLLFFALFVCVSFLGLLLDGFDIGVGCLIGVAPAEMRPRMLALLSPWRDANELWLFMGLGLLATAFPGAWAGLLGHLFIPLFVLAMGIFIRSVCFEWRLRAPELQQPKWAMGFFLGSLMVALAHGLLVAQVVVNGQWEGGYFWFSLLIGGCSIAAYLLLGATWLIMREAGVLRVRSVVWARRSIRWFAAGVVAASVVLALENAGIFLKWTEGARLWSVYFFWASLLACFVGIEMCLQRLVHRSIRTTALPFVLSLCLFCAVAIGFVFSFFPFFVLDQITLWDAAAPVSTLYSIGMMALIALPFVLFFNFRVYWRVFGVSRPPQVPDYDRLNN